MKLIIFLIAVFGQFIVLGQTVYFDVTTNQLGASNSIDMQMTAAINSANSGFDAVVRLYNNSTSSNTITITQKLPTVDITNGTLTITKHPNVSVPQIIQSNFPSGTIPSNNHMIKIDSSLKKVTISELTFKSHSAQQYGTTGIIVSKASDYLINNNRFESEKGVSLSACSGILSENIFDDCQACIFLGNYYLSNNALTGAIGGSILIDNNTFSGSSNAHSGVRMTLNENIINDIQITNNNFNNISACITIGYHQGSSEGHTVNISNNDITTAVYGLRLYAPHRNWIVEDNLIADASDVAIGLFGGGSSAIDFIQSGSINSVNTGNIITNCEHSFTFQTFTEPCIIIGYDVDGMIRNDLSIPLEIRQTLIDIDPSQWGPIGNSTQAPHGQALAGNNEIIPVIN